MIRRSIAAFAFATVVFGCAGRGSVVSPSPTPPIPSATSSALSDSVGQTPVPLPTPTVARTPGVAATAAAPVVAKCDGNVKTTFASVEEPSLQDAALWAKSAFIGQVESVAHARWTHDDADMAGDAFDWIYTPVQMSVVKSYRGDEPVGTAVSVPVAGGIVGCDGYSVAGLTRDFAVGQKYLVCLIDPKLVPGARRLTGLYSIEADSLATPDGPVAVDTVGTLIAAAGYLPYPQVPTARP